LFHYIDGAADDESTLRCNTQGFEDYDLLPRFLVNVDEVDTSTTVLGQRIEFPVIIAPTGGSRAYHHEGERAVARAGSVYTLSTYSSVSIEDIATETNGPKMFQLYVLRDRDFTAELIERSKVAGYKALYLSVDCPVIGNRERDLRASIASRRSLPLMSLLNVMAHPKWVWHYVMARRIEFANMSHITDKEAMGGNSLAQFVKDMTDPTVTWDDAAWIIDQ